MSLFLRLSSRLSLWRGVGGVATHTRSAEFPNQLIRTKKMVVSTKEEADASERRPGWKHCYTLENINGKVKAVLRQQTLKRGRPVKKTQFSERNWIKVGDKFPMEGDYCIGSSTKTKSVQPLERQFMNVRTKVLIGLSVRTRRDDSHR